MTWAQAPSPVLGEHSSPSIGLPRIVIPRRAYQQKEPPARTWVSLESGYGILNPAMPKSLKRSTTGAADRSQSSTFAVVIMAAGKGTRLKSRHPKVLHEVGGTPLLAHVVSAATKVVTAKDVYAIVGHEAERVRQAMQGSGIRFILQA